MYTREEKKESRINDLDFGDGESADRACEQEYVGCENINCDKDEEESQNREETTKTRKYFAYFPGDLGKRFCDTKKREKILRILRDVADFVLEVSLWSADSRRLYHTLVALQIIKTNIVTDKLHLCWWGADTFSLITRNEAVPSSISSEKTAHFMAVRAAVLRKTVDYVSEIGDFQSQYGSLLDLGIQEDRRPIVGRRREQGVYSHYLSALSRELRGQLNLLLDELEVYPADKPRTSKGHNQPILMHSWTHEATSEAINFRDATGSNLVSQKVKEDETDKHKHRPSKDNVHFIKTSYWMPERPDLQSSIAHEVAHNLLIDRAHNFSEYSMDEFDGVFSELIKHFFDVLDKLDYYDFERSRRELSNLPLECACDLLAASVTGHAYLFAFHLEIVGAQLHTFFHLPLEQVDLQMADFLGQALGDIQVGFSWYVRAKVLCKWLELTQFVEPEPNLFKVLRGGITLIADDIMDLIAKKMGQRGQKIKLYWVSVADHFSDLIESTRTPDLVRRWREKRSGPESRPWLHPFERNTRTLQEKLRAFIGKSLLRVKMGEGHWLMDFDPKRWPNEEKTKLYERAARVFGRRYFDQKDYMKVSFDEQKLKLDYNDNATLYRHIYDVSWETTLLGSIDFVHSHDTKIDKQNGPRDILPRQPEYWLHNMHFHSPMGRGFYQYVLEFFLWDSRPPLTRLSTTGRLLKLWICSFNNSQKLGGAAQDDKILKMIDEITFELGYSKKDVKRCSFLADKHKGASCRCIWKACEKRGPEIDEAKRYLEDSLKVFAPDRRLPWTESSWRKVRRDPKKLKTAVCLLAEQSPAMELNLLYSYYKSRSRKEESTETLRFIEKAQGLKLLRLRGAVINLMRALIDKQNSTEETDAVFFRRLRELAVYLSIREKENPLDRDYPEKYISNNLGIQLLNYEQAIDMILESFEIGMQEPTRINEGIDWLSKKDHLRDLPKGQLYLLSRISLLQIPDSTELEDGSNTACPGESKKRSDRNAGKSIASLLDNPRWLSASRRSSKPDFHRGIFTVVLGRYDVIGLTPTRPMSRRSLPFLTESFSKVDNKGAAGIADDLDEEYFPFFLRRELTIPIRFPGGDPDKWPLNIKVEPPEKGKKYCTQNTPQITAFLAVTLTQRLARLTFMTRLLYGFKIKNLRKANQNSEIVELFSHYPISGNFEQGTLLDVADVLDADKDCALLGEGWADVILVLAGGFQGKDDNDKFICHKEENRNYLKSIFDIQNIIYHDFLVDHTELVLGVECAEVALCNPDLFNVQIQIRLSEDSEIKMKNSVFLKKIEQVEADHQQNIRIIRTAGLMDFTVIFHGSRPDDDLRQVYKEVLEILNTEKDLVESSNMVIGLRRLK